MLYGKNPDEMFVPASATKLFTAAAVLETLGPDYRFKTPVYVTPAANGSGSDVNLVLVASGDPNMGGRTLPDGTIAVYEFRPQRVERDAHANGSARRS